MIIVSQSHIIFIHNKLPEIELNTLINYYQITPLTEQIAAVRDTGMHMNKTQRIKKHPVMLNPIFYNSAKYHPASNYRMPMEL